MTSPRIAAAAVGVLTLACLTAAGGHNDPGADKTLRAATTPTIQIDAHRVAVIRAQADVKAGKRRKPGTVYRANSRTVCKVYLLHRKCERKLSRGAKARKAARITRHRRYLAAKYQRHQRYLMGKRNGFRVARIYAQMQKIDQASVPYLWGGGHARQIGWSEPVTPMDCSGSVSRALGIFPRTSSGFMSYGSPGPGRVTIYANSIHVYMSITVNGVTRFWGTSRENPGGGPGWHSARSGAGFVVRHVA